MRKKIGLFVILVIFLCTGCSVEYTLEIDEDLQVKESVTASADGSFFNEYENIPAQTVVGFILEPYLDYLNENKYTIDQFFSSSSAGVNINNRFDSLQTYKDVSKFSEQYASEWTYSEDGDEVTLTIKGHFNVDEQNQDGGFLVDDAKINIRLPFEVKNHNADIHEEGSQVYTWVIDKEDPIRELTITFDKKVKKSFGLIYAVIGVSIVIVLIIAYIVLGMIRENKQNNKI